MKVTQKDTYTILEDERDDVLKFASYLEHVVPEKYEDLNLVIDLLQYTELTLEQLVAFIKLSNYQRADKKSFVIVNTGIDYDVIPDEMMVVPTLQEAEDIIQMEEIERDLGF
ncbi:ribonuclease Z [uncultured Dokdonia sp.]|uniref:ribonuclease Z n=1 Tax=uncultured Dokdonia sp. TaxID=575653 RepID=UPI0026379D88|nr:ribonuclease Z [uncultured Dokdonia sp.]